MNDETTSKGGSVAAPQSAEELTTFVQTTLEQMQSRFRGMSEAIIEKIEDLGARVDELEESVKALSEDERGGEKK